jgi:predicted glycogen debranching enzyme
MNDEFLSTNELAGYASYSLSEGVTRKYHGLLVAGVDNVDRKVVMPTINEAVIINNQRHDFSGNYYRNKEYPEMVKYITKAYFLPYPTQLYSVHGVEIKKQVLFSEDTNKVEIVYTVRSPQPAELIIEPLITFRDFHNIGLHLHINDVDVDDLGGSQQIILNDRNKIIIKADGYYEENIALSEEHFYKKEAERGYQAYEDLIKVANYRYEVKPGVNQFRFSCKLSAKSSIKRVFTLADDIISPSNNTSIATDVTRFKNLYPSVDDSFEEFLVYNARKFIIRDQKRYSLIAGYHWFGEWSRDTFISFKGTFLGLGRYHEAERVLLDWGKYISVGLLPNQMQGMHFNSIDGILWYIVAVWQYWEETKDKETIVHLLPKLERVIYALARGTKYGISVDAKGFLIWTDESKALTWMDAIVDGNPVTPRVGAAVDIQALWYNALQIVEKLALLNKYDLINLPLLDQLEQSIEQNFENSFWLEEKGYYADYIDLQGKANEELRPNQLAVFALPFRLGNLNSSRSVIKQTEEKLLTDVGLRTLSPDSANYIANYQGDQPQRDAAYHQGIIWPWLLKYYYQAVLNANNYNDESKTKVREHLKLVWQKLLEKQIISVPEVFSNDGLEPGGTVSQAWSVAALIEGIMELHSKYHQIYEPQQT